MTPRLFHYSDDPGIERFEPRAVDRGTMRQPGMEWLNGPLVWAIADWHQPMYLFPRNCPRILLWRLPSSTPEDIDRFFGESSARMLAHVEAHRLTELCEATLYRYELPTDNFDDLGDAGMWVSRKPVRPVDMTVVDSLPERLAEANVELRVMASLVPLRDVWSTTLHASGIRLRFARDFED